MSANRFASFWLVVTAVVCGAVVMAVELLGARMLSAGFGGSMAVWAAMISVTLLSLAVGYFIGGNLADRRPRPAILHSILLVAGILLSACPYARFVLKACYDSLGIQGGALASSAIIFFLPLGLLGMVSPFVIRVLSGEGRGVGVTAGGIYALSTLGSVAGTLLTGLWIIPQFGTSTGFKITAITTVITAAAGLISAVGWKASPSLAIILAMAVLPGPSAKVGETYTAPDGEKVEIKAVRDSAHGRIVVLQKGRYNLLVVNGIVQTGIPQNLSFLEKGQSLASNYFQELIPYMVDQPRAASALIIGLAGGMTASLLMHYEMDVEAVEIDPEIIAIARQWFSYTGPAVAADGRQYIEDCRKTYDFCVIDTYSGDVFPFYLASVEAFSAAKKVLKPSGVLAINYIGEPKGEAFASLYRTLREVFPNILALKGEYSDDVQTITVFASAEPLSIRNRWVDSLWNFKGVDPISEAIAQLTIEPPKNQGMILTDDRNPIDFLRSKEALRWRMRTVHNIGERAIF